MKGKFYAIGVGIGNKEYLTLKAEKLIKKLPILCAPISKKGKKSYALEVIKDLIDLKRQKVMEIFLPMSMDNKILKNIWDKSLEKITIELDKGFDIGFLTIGDPTFYSSFSYILSYLKKRSYEFEIVPGITSVSLCMALAKISLVGFNEKLAIVPAVHKLNEIKDIISKFDTVVLMKVNKVFDELRLLLKDLNLLKSSIYLKRCGMENSKIIYGIDNVKEEDLDYFSMIIIKK